MVAPTAGADGIAFFVVRRRESFQFSNSQTTTRFGPRLFQT
jgi:hypothetical protein